jgi:ADP-ribose pyrophosphatase YjhB (NUDIX family)
MADQPIAYTAEGRPLFDNTPTVVCMIVENNKGQVLAVRRANEPGKGLLGLPGGYHMRGETWQEAGFREVLEETGIKLHFSGDVSVMSVETDEYGNNLIIAEYPWPVTQPGSPQDGEATEIVWISKSARRSDEWAFPRHLDAVNAHFDNRD